MNYFYKIIQYLYISAVNCFSYCIVLYDFTRDSFRSFHHSHFFDHFVFVHRTIWQLHKNNFEA